jgi:outer membrane protein assembly factor BamB
MSPIIVDGLCIAHLGADKGGAIVAYDLNNGSEKWRWADDAPSYGSPVIAEIGGTRQLITPTQSRLVGISVADGKLLWSLEYMGGRMYNSGTPIVDGSNVYIVGDAKVIGVKVESQGGALTAKELWSLKTHTSRFTTPVLKDGQLYGVNSQGALYCLKGETGEQVWQDTSRRGDPAFVLDAGPVLLCVATNSELAVLEPGNSGVKEIAKFKIAGSEVWSYPIFSGNRVYIKDSDSLTLWTIE